MSRAGFSFDASPTPMIYLSDLSELTSRMPFSDCLKERAGGGERLEQFVREFRDFASQSKFVEFFKIQESLTFISSFPFAQCPDFKKFFQNARSIGKRTKP